MKKLLPLVLIIPFFSCKEQAKTISLNDVFPKGKWIDLTYEFSDKTLYWPNNPTGFKLDTQFNGITPAGFYYASNAFFTPEHGGTHLDAPVHFAKGKWSTADIPLDRLSGEAVVIDVSKKVNDNADYLISVCRCRRMGKTKRSDSC